MNRELKQKYIELSKLSKEKGVPEGYIYIGEGDSGPRIFGRILLFRNLEFGKVWQKGQDCLGYYDNEYAAPQAVWDKVINPVNIYTDNLFIKTHAPSLSAAIQTKLFSLGFSWHDGDKQHRSTHLPYIILNLSGEKKIDAFSYPNSSELSLDELFAITPPRTLTNPELGISCIETTIEIAAQTISFERFDEMVAAVSAFRNPKSEVY